MRIDYHADDRVNTAMRGLNAAVAAGPLEPSLVQLVEVRASQLNGCAHCLEMHAKQARAHGESDDRLHLLAAWRESGTVFTERERAALAWCDELTLLAQRDVPDELFESVSGVFDDAELCSLTLAVVAINGWNRFAVSFRAPVGDYVVPHAAGDRS
ncbi:MAG TPA: carboxymuconolactone decarboxylase family protein [Jatrophihabitantaceae bacterium]|nr:carboxymuconolactone decarboxylase family protein [Jatrophihabitantaceae bacterium]